MKIAITYRNHETDYVEEYEWEADALYDYLDFILQTQSKAGETKVVYADNWKPGDPLLWARVFLTTHDNEVRSWELHAIPEETEEVWSISVAGPAAKTRLGLSGPTKVFFYGRKIYEVAPTITDLLQDPSVNWIAWETGGMKTVVTRERPQ